MIIRINNVPVSVPTVIADWAEMNDDNYTELEGFIQSIVYAAKKSKQKNVDTNDDDSFAQGLRDFLSVLV